jgi:hypothetical protein
VVLVELPVDFKESLGTSKPGLWSVLELDDFSWRAMAVAMALPAAVPAAIAQVDKRGPLLSPPPDASPSPAICVESLAA